MDTINSANFPGAGVYEVPPKSLWNVRLRTKNEDDTCMPFNSNWIFLCQEEHQKEARYVQKDRYFTRVRKRDTAVAKRVATAQHERMSNYLLL